MDNSTLPRFRPLNGVHEPSAIQQLPDGRFLVVEDEVNHSLSICTLAPDGAIHCRALTPGWFEGNEAFWKLDDLEGLTLDASGHVLAITSHSRDGDGDEKKARDKLVRFRIEGDRVTDTRVVKGLKRALISAHPVLASAAAKLDVKTDGGLNIESLEMAPDGGRLLIGFRSPLMDGRAIIASVLNAQTMFDGEALPHISPQLDTLDLDGHGLRSLSYVPALKGYVLISGPVAREQVQFRLWFWTGERGGAARPITVGSLPGFEHAEGVSPAQIGDRQCLILVSDDGSRDAGRFGRFLVIDLELLQIGD